MASTFALAVLMNPTAVGAEHTSDAFLPDLAMLQPDDFRLERNPGGVRWLRFSTTIVNVGVGRFDVYGSESDANDSTKLNKVTQRVEEEGGWVEHATAATMFYAGDGHNHWHVYGLQEWRLAFEATPNDTIATGAKTGFCFWDNVDLWGSPSFYSGSWACKMDDQGTVPMGLSVGWGDEYPSTIAFQYIDISEFPYGDYCLTLVADPRAEFIEATTVNNTVRTLISIQTKGVTVLAPDCDGAVAPPSGTLSGTVTDASTSSAISGATISVVGTTLTGTTDGNGDYSLSGVPIDTYNVTASASGYDGSTQSATINEDATTTLDFALTASSTGGSGTMHIESLTDLGSGNNGSTWTARIRVTITDNNGSPVPGATVSGLWSYNANSISDTCDTVSDSNGQCDVILSGIPKRYSSATLTVSSVTDTLTWDGIENSLMVFKP